MNGFMYSMILAIFILQSDLVLALEKNHILGLELSYGHGNADGHRDIYNEIRKHAFDKLGQSQMLAVGVAFGGYFSEKRSFTANFSYAEARSEIAENEFKLSHERSSILMGFEFHYYWSIFFAFWQIGYDIIISDILTFEADSGRQNIDTESRAINFKDFGFYDLGVGINLGTFRLFVRRRNNRHFLINRSDFFIGGVSYQI